ncbi:MAG: DUF1987 domain-containing protein [Bacteroidales bacterium]|nr:DUF1987 domain-containing protein [Bacteroidales bacterium]
MTALSIKGTADEPTIRFDNQSGVLYIGGSSLPANVIEFYAPVFNWIEEYKDQAPCLTHVELNLEYLNTASTNVIARIIDSVQELAEKNRLVTFTWYYCTGDYDMKELAEEIFEDTQCKYETVEVKEILSYDSIAA